MLNEAAPTTGQVNGKSEVKRCVNRALTVGIILLTEDIFQNDP